MELLLLALFFLFNQIRGDEHIIGGTEVNIEQYPFAAAILLNGEFNCGGVILSDVTILTAAHCADKIPAGDLTVRVGSARHDSGGQLLSVASAHVHPRYNAKTIDYDVATLTLSSSIDLSDPNVSSIALDLLSLARPSAGTEVTAIGWGLTSDNGNDSIFLQAVENAVVAQQSCRSKLDMFGKDVITDRMICAESTPIGRGVCPGDSGGALIDSNTNALVGLTSFGVHCGAAYPSVFAWMGNLEIEAFVELRLLLDSIGL